MRNISSNRSRFPQSLECRSTNQNGGEGERSVSREDAADVVAESMDTTSYLHLLVGSDIITLRTSFGGSTVQNSEMDLVDINC